MSVGEGDATSQRDGVRAPCNLIVRQSPVDEDREAGERVWRRRSSARRVGDPRHPGEVTVTVLIPRGQVACRHGRAVPALDTLVIHPQQQTTLAAWQPVQRLVVLQVRGLHTGARAIREERPASLLEDGLRRLPVRQVEHEGGANSAVLSTAQPARQQAAERTQKRTRTEDGTLSGRDCVASLAVFRNGGQGDSRRHAREDRRHDGACAFASPRKKSVFSNRCPARATASRSGTRLALGAYGLNSRHSSFCLAALDRLHACASGGPFATLDGAATSSRRLRSALRRESGTCLPLSAPHLAASEAPTRARGVERAVPAAQVVSGARSFASVFRRAPISRTCVCCPSRHRRVA